MCVHVCVHVCVSLFFSRRHGWPRCRSRCVQVGVFVCVCVCVCTCIFGGRRRWPHCRCDIWIDVHVSVHTPRYICFDTYYKSKLSNISINIPGEGYISYTVRWQTCVAYFLGMVRVILGNCTYEYMKSFVTCIDIYLEFSINISGEGYIFRDIYIDRPLWHLFLLCIYSWHRACYLV